MNPQTPPTESAPHPQDAPPTLHLSPQDFAAMTATPDDSPSFEEQVLALTKEISTTSAKITPWACRVDGSNFLNGETTTLTVDREGQAILIKYIDHNEYRVVSVGGVRIRTGLQVPALVVTPKSPLVLLTEMNSGGSLVLFGYRLVASDIRRPKVVLLTE